MKIFLNYFYKQAASSVPGSVLPGGVAQTCPCPCPRKFKATRKLCGGRSSELRSEFVCLADFCPRSGLCLISINMSGIWKKGNISSL